MPAPTYTYNDENVSKLDGGYIEATGGYVVSIKSATAEQSQKGNWGVGLFFEDEAGQTPRFPLTLWTLKADGSRIFGHDILDSILICAGMKPASALKPGTVKAPYWDPAERKLIEQDADGYPALTSRRVGLILQKETYLKPDGSEGTRMQIMGAYHPDTRLSAGEIITGKTEPVATDRKLAGLRDKDSTGGGFSSTAQSPTSPAKAHAQPAGDFDDFDSIPF